MEALTAEVRVLMVGSRQVTLSVFRQLDIISVYSLGPLLGRVSDRPPGRHADALGAGIWLIGRDPNGSLARAYAYPESKAWLKPEMRSYLVADSVMGHLQRQPLVVLAGLR